MADALTLPGTIPGLLRRGSPAIAASGSAVVRSLEQRGFIGCEPVDGAVVAWDAPLDTLGWLALDDLSLDLTDATGRAHAAWCYHRIARTIPEGRDWMATCCAPPVLEDWLGYDCLSDLDPNDPRTLPDGSRWVDAEALRRVVLHAAGLATVPPRSEG